MLTCVLNYFLKFCNFLPFCQWNEVASSKLSLINSNWTMLGLDEKFLKTGSPSLFSVFDLSLGLFDVTIGLGSSKLNLPSFSNIWEVNKINLISWAWLKWVLKSDPNKQRMLLIYAQTMLVILIHAFYEDTCNRLNKTIARCYQWQRKLEVRIFIPEKYAFNLFYSIMHEN